MRLNKVSNSVVVMVVAGVVALGLVGMSVYAQNAAGELSASGGVKVNLSGGLGKGVGKIAGGKSSAETPKGMEQVEERVKGMQDSIKAAVAQFQKANGSADEKIARLNSVLASIDNSLQEIGETGTLYKEMDKAIKASEDIQKKYKDKATDPKIEAKIREKYEKLLQKTDKNINDLVERRMMLSKARADLEKRKTSLGQEKDFIVDLMTQSEISAANDALIQVLDSVKGVVQSIDDFAENITASPAAASTGKEQK